MAVKELFLTVGFENIIKALRNTHRNDESIQNVAAYKEAFDTICLTEFEGEGGEVTFNVTSPREAWYEPHKLPLLANNVEGDYWENTVGKLYLPYIKDKRKKRELKGKKEMPHGIAFSMEIWNRIHQGEKHQNRAKRKRFYRLERRIAELKRLDKRREIRSLLLQI